MLSGSMIENNTIISDLFIKYWKDLGFWLLDHWYWFVIAIVCYFVFMFLYKYLRDLVLKKL